MTKLSLLLLLLLLQACCTPTHTITTTSTLHDTLIMTPAARADTMWRSAPRDTLVLHQDRLVVRIEKQHDTLRIAGQCRPDTLRIPIVREVVRKTTMPTRHNPLLLGLALGAAAMLLLLFWLRR